LKRKPVPLPKCKKHCKCARTLKKVLRENKELRIQNGELARKYYGRKKKKNKKDEIGIKTEPKKKGAPFGHPGWYRKIPEHIDKVEMLIPDKCHRCGSHRLEPTKFRHDEHIQEDIILPKRIVKKFVRPIFKCKECHAFVRGPKGTDEMPNAYIGPKAKAWANQLRYEIGIPQHKIKMIFTELFDMPFVQASVAGFENQLRRRSQNLYDEIKTQVVNAPARYVDETGWKENGELRQLWCLCNAQVVFFHIDQSRGGKVIKNILGAKFKGTITTDFYSAYKVVEGWKQKCIPHLLRLIQRKELSFSHESKQAAQFLEEFKNLSKHIMKLHRDRKKIKDFLIHRADVVSRIKTHLSTSIEHEPLDKWREKINKHSKELTTCLFHPKSDSNNNFVERMLRLSVIMRKITFGNRSPKGIKNHQVIMSLVKTMGLHKKTSAEYFERILINPAKVSLDHIIGDVKSKKTQRDPPIK